MVVNLILDLLGWNNDENEHWACCNICHNSYECWAQCPNCKKHICEKCECMDRFPPDIELCQICPSCNTMFDIVRKDDMHVVNVDPKNFVEGADDSWTVMASKQVRDFFYLDKDNNSNNGDNKNE